MVRVGILGFAHGHVNAYCKQWADNDEIAVVAGWDHDAGRLAEAVENYQLTPYSDAAALLALDLDGVVIAAETVRHAELAELAAAAGKAIVMQKPLALNMAHGERIVRAVERYQVPFTVAWQMRVDPQNLQLKALIEGGTLGRLLMVRRRHGLSTHVWGSWFTDSWHVRPDQNRGMWADDAAHAVDFLLWLLGEPETVTAEIETLLDPRVPDDNGIAIYRYADGTIAEVSSSFTCVASENTTEVIGEKGVAIQNYGDAPSCNAPRPVGGIGLKWYLHGDDAWRLSEIASPSNHGARINALHQPLFEFLAGRRPPLATARDGLTALRMTLACYQSAALGQRVRLSDFRED